ncbi:MAG: hypothetical protein NVSMB6_16890 [Burkholderiaceae bacterium]
MNQFNKIFAASVLAAVAGIAGAQTSTQPLSPGAKSLNDTDKTPSSVSGTAATGDRTSGNLGSGATAGGSSGASVSSDPYIQKREADAVTKQEYKDRKKAAKAEYKHEKSSAKAEARASKMEAKAERNSEIKAERSSTPVVPGQQSTLGK